MGLTAPQLGMFPKSRGQDFQAVGYVGWNMWLWVADPGPTTWGPITASASDGGYTVTATAEVDQVEWDMGNGEVVTCGQGTRHPPMAVRSEPSPDCGYIYQHDGYYTVTATTYWEVQWTGPSASGTLQLDMGRADEVAIAEAQVVNIPVDQ